jgi:hypothetical protein
MPVGVRQTSSFRVRKEFFILTKEFFLVRKEFFFVRKEFSLVRKKFCNYSAISVIARSAPQRRSTRTRSVAEW